MCRVSAWLQFALFPCLVSISLSLSGRLTFPQLNSAMLTQLQDKNTKLPFSGDHDVIPCIICRARNFSNIALSVNSGFSRTLSIQLKMSLSNNIASLIIEKINKLDVYFSRNIVQQSCLALTFLCQWPYQYS